MKLAVLLSAVFLLILGASVPAAAWDTTGLVKEWKGVLDLRPYDIEILSDGSVWMTHEESGNGTLIYRNQQTNAFEVFTAAEAAHFWTLDAAADDTLWVTDDTGAVFHFFPETGTFVRYSMPPWADPVLPYGVTVAPDGKIWVTCQGSIPCIGIYNPATFSWTRHNVTDGAYPPGVPVEIAFESDGTAWFTIKKSGGSGYAGLGRLTTGGVMTVWTNPTIFFGGSVPIRGGLTSPWGLVVTAEDPARVWFTDKTTGILVRFDEGIPPVVTWYDLLPDNLIDAHFIAEDPAGKIWLSAMGPDLVGNFDPATGTSSVLTLRTSAKPMGIGISPLGEVWWSETGLHGIVQGGAGRFIPFRDRDNDGIANGIDKKPHVYSRGFRDTATGTRGSITDRGNQRLSIVDSPDPYGIRVISGKHSGSDPARIALKCTDGGEVTTSQITITRNDDAIFTCGFPPIVLRGPVRVS